MMTPKGDHVPKSGAITALTPSVKNRDRTTVFIDGEFAFGIWTDLVVKNGLHVGMQLSETQVQHLMQDEGVLKARSSALHFLTYASRTEHQVRERLAKQKFHRRIIHQVIRELYDLGYIDDRKYAMEYAEARFKNKGYGPDRIRRELISDGVSHQCVEAAIDQNSSEELLQERAKTLAERFLVRVHGTYPEKRKKLTAYLVRRGYEYIMAKQLVSEVLRQSESDRECT